VEIPTSLRKPAPNGSANGANGSQQPGVVPEPTAPQPPAPGSGVFGPPDNGGYGQPYGGYPPPPGPQYPAE
jgi:hypothetical protein